MNLLFQTRKPRRFHHEPIYYSEREDRLRKLEEQARKQLAQTADRDKEEALNETDAFRKETLLPTISVDSFATTVAVLRVICWAD